MIVDEGFFWCFLVWVVYLLLDRHVSFEVFCQGFLRFWWRGWQDTAFLWKTGQKKASWNLMSLGLLACWTQTLILKGALQLSFCVVTISESRRNMKTFNIYQSWGCAWLLDYFASGLLCTHELLLLLSPSPFSPAVSWGFGPRNQANHIIIVQMAIISVCDSDNRSQDTAGFGKFQLCCRDGISSQKNSVWI